LSEIIDHFNMRKQIRAMENTVAAQGLGTGERSRLDFADVKGQEYAKRAITVAVAGGHGIIMTGSPSTGKTMLAERIPTIMPAMTYEEILEASIIYSVAGLLDEERPYISERPFRRPHHKITAAGLIGGGAYPRPGEITLASGGVLFTKRIKNDNISRMAGCR
jgi:magnesium chelatase family protein